MATERLESLLRDAFPHAAELAVEDRTGTGDHFQVVVSDARFAGLSLVDQHRLVYEALGDLMQTIHALSLRTNAS